MRFNRNKSARDAFDSFDLFQRRGGIRGTADAVLLSLAAFEFAKPDEVRLRLWGSAHNGDAGIRAADQNVINLRLHEKKTRK